MKTKGILIVVVILYVVSLAAFAAPVVVKVKPKPQPQAQPIVKTRIFNSPSMAIMISGAQSLSELKDVTERFIDVIGHYDAVAPETIVASLRDYIEALRILDGRVSQGLGFGAVLEDARVRPELEAKLEPLKQQLL